MCCCRSRALTVLAPPPIDDGLRASGAFNASIRRDGPLMMEVQAAKASSAKSADVSKADGVSEREQRQKNREEVIASSCAILSANAPLCRKLISLSARHSPLWLHIRCCQCWPPQKFAFFHEKTQL